MSEAEIAFDSIEHSVFERFSHVAAQFPEKLAVDDGGLRYTFAGLHAHSCAMAREIESRAQAGRKVVAVLMPTDALHIAAVLAILQSGRVYLSLDPTYPPARLREMLAAAHVALVVTSAALRDRARELEPHAILEVAPPGESASALKKETTAAPETSADAFACLYFTSGSTGTPKAVVHTHRNILFDIRRQTRDMRVTADDRFDLLFSASFSAFLSPVFGALLTGASVHPFNLKAHPFEELRDWLRREAITVSTMSVSSFRQLVSVLEPRRDFPALRMLSVGAEPLALQDLSAFQNHFAENAQMQNALATTETRTIAQNYFPATGPMPAQMAVGFPVEGKALTLRDESGKVVAPGEVGEIVIESLYISPGTWQSLRGFADAKRTAPRMMTHRTGDLARFLPDGQIAHLGRIDTQVKIRGHRIEVGEIESALLAHPSVKDVAVFAHGADTGREMLVALIVARQGCTIDAVELRRHLHASLPDYMVPNRFVATDALPATATGKLDRRQLPAALAQLDANTRAADAQIPTSPTNSREAQMLTVWREVLGHPSLGLDDDFFAAGGDSLGATRLAARLVILFQTTVAPGLLLEAPTVRLMAARLAESGATTTRLARVELQRGRQDRTPLYLFPPWNSGSVLFRHLKGCENSGAPLLALEGSDAASAERPVNSIEDIAALHVEALLEMHPSAGFAIGGYSMSGFIAWEVAQRLSALGRAPEHVVLLDCPRLYSTCSAEDEAWIARVSSLRGRTGTLARLLTKPGRLARTTILAQTVSAFFLRARWHAYDRWFPGPAPAWEADYRRNVDLSQHYRVQPYDGAVTLVRARRQADWFNRVQHDLGWTRFCRGPFTIVDLPGDHHAMFVEPGVRHLNRALHTAVPASEKVRVEV